MTDTLLVIDDPIFAEHRAPGDHPERPERLDAARAAVVRADTELAARSMPAPDVADDDLVRVHRPQYIEALGRAAGTHGYLDPDTYHAPMSVAAARRAAGGAVGLVDALLDGDAAGGVALVRPPGHHAKPNAAMGFCLINNVAVAAAHARARGVERVAVLDWDVHHGNGTQEMFWTDPSVLFVSLHQFPYYPGTGDASEVGAGDGCGATVNVPLPAGSDDATYAAAFERIVVPIVDQFAPDLLLISAGFDAHRRDPLAGMELSDAAYSHMLREVASVLPGAAGRIALLLEGGYDLRGLEGALAASLAELDRVLRSEPRASVPPAPSGELAERAIDRVLRHQREYWKLD